MIPIEDFQNKSDEELVKLTIQNPDWYGGLVKRYEHKLTRYIFRISGLAREDIEDLLQEIFLTVYRNLNDFDQSLKFSSWIYRITHNKVISYYRSNQARTQTINGEEGEKILALIKDGKDLHEKISSRLTGEVVRKLLAELDSKYKEVLVLKYLEERDYQEISDILKKPIGTVGTLLSRAKEKLREAIKNGNIGI